MILNNDNAPFNARFFPQQILLLAVGENIMPMGYWMVISKNPFRFLICLEVSNHSLKLLRKYQEAALHFTGESRQNLFTTPFNKMEKEGLIEKLGNKRETTNGGMANIYISSGKINFSNQDYYELKDKLVTSKHSAEIITISYKEALIIFFISSAIKK